MLVDDEPAILKALQRELGPWSRQNKHQILFFTSAKEALAAIRENNGSIDLLVTDLRMPEMGGSDLLQLVKEKWPDVPAILLTGFADTHEISRAMRSGLHGFILKPWEPGSLTEEFEKVLSLVNASEARKHRQRKSQTELKLAGELSRLILEVPPIDGCPVDFEVLSRPLAQLRCGGDYCDVIRLSKNRVFLTVGEFAGHGIIGSLGASLLKSVVASRLAAAGKRGIDLSRFMAGLAHQFREVVRTTTLRGVSLTAVIIDTGAMTMDWASAGRLPMLLMRDGSWSLFFEPQPALGMSEDVRYHVGRIPLSRGNEILLCTDGLTEIGGGREPGAAGLCRLAGRWKASDLSSLCSLVLAEVGATDFTDDVSVLHAAVPREASHE